MPQLTFYPIGNADCCLIDLAGGEKILFDYADMRDPNNKDDRRIDLAQALRDNLADADRDDLDVVAFSHLDKDHICGSSEIFHLEHAAKYQGAGRIKIKTLWVPAAAIIEDGCEDEARIIRAEARHRLKAGAGIRVFSRPDLLNAWLEKNRLTLESRRNLITDAGQLAPEFSIERHGVEFFVHSPFASRVNDTEVVDRNKDSLFMQATFVVNGVATRVLLTGDAEHEAIDEIVRITRLKRNDIRLHWDVVNLPHHCSYLSLAEEKGETVTVPKPRITWLYEQGQPGGKLIATSKPIPADDRDVQPPHRQAANYYKGVAKSLAGEFRVTMEHPSATKTPEPLVIAIDETKARIKTAGSFGIAGVLSRPAPRAG